MMVKFGGCGGHGRCKTHRGDGGGAGRDKG